MRNSDPRVRSVSVYRFNSDFHFVFTLQVTGCDLQIRVQLQPFGSYDFSPRGKVYSRHFSGSANCKNLSVCVSWSIVRLQLLSGILHQHKSLPRDLVVEAFPFVLFTFAIHFLVQEFQSRVWVSLSISLLARKVDQIALPQQVSLFLFDSYCILHTSLRLLFLILSWLTEMIVRKTVSIASPSAQNVWIIFHLLCFWACFETMDSWLGRLGVRFLRIWSSLVQRLDPIFLLVFSL